jgi:hypothetical protein
MSRLLFRCSFLVALVLLAACNHHATPVANDGTSPEVAVKEAVDLLGKGDFAGYWKYSLPPADFQQLRADWPRRPSSLDDIDRKRLLAALRQLSAPDADKHLWDQVKPFVLHYEHDYRDQMPLMIGIFQSMAITAIGDAKSLSTAQKALARDSVIAIAPWAQQAPWGDAALAHKSIAIATDAGHQLKLADTPTDFDTSMHNGSIAWHAFDDIAKLYGLALDDAFDSVQTQALETTAGSARVQVNYTLGGKPLNIEVSLVLEDGHWYDRDLLAAVRATHIDIAHTPPEPAPAGTSAAPR